MNKKRGWFWKIHGDEYERATVRDIKSFCGWGFLLKLIKECEKTQYGASPMWSPEKREEYRQRLIRRDQALVATLFETGGRVIEVLRLTRENFNFTDEWIRVVGMQVVKRHRKNKRTGETTRIYTTRGKFSIPRDEALVPYMERWIRKQDDYIFPSPKKGREHISTVRAYQIVHDLGERLDTHIYNHWFRAQRACQLAEELDFDVIPLQNFFSWRDAETASRYAKLSTKALEKKMRPDWR